MKINLRKLTFGAYAEGGGIVVTGAYTNEFGETSEVKAWVGGGEPAKLWLLETDRQITFAEAYVFMLLLYGVLAAVNEASRGCLAGMKGGALLKRVRHYLVSVRSNTRRMAAAKSITLVGRKKGVNP